MSRSKTKPKQTEQTPIQLSKEEYDQKLKELREMEEMLRLKQGLPHLFGYPWYTWARRIFESKNREILCTAANQLSKDIEENEFVPTQNGFKKMKDINVGDYVFNKIGKPTKVIDIPYHGYGPGYLLTFTDGSSVVCGPNHDWICKGSKERFRKSYKSSNGREFLNDSYDKWIVKPLKDILKKYTPDCKPYERYSIPICEKVSYEGVSKEIIDPYALGYLIGNGSLSSKIIKVTINKNDKDVSEYFCKNLGAIQQGKDIDYRLPISVRNVIRSIGLDVHSYNKNIPSELLISNCKSRFSLLQGLMDSDGTVNEAGNFSSYSTTSKKLAYNVCELVHSLGGIAEIKERKSSYKKNGVYIECRNCFIVSVFMIENPFRCKRKASRWKCLDRYKHERVIKRIEYIGEIKSKCITVDSEDGSFLVTNNYIVTHNSSTAIRRNIHLATAPQLWKDYWPNLMPGQKPNLFWYFYPTRDVCSTEFETKWLKEFLPQGEFETHPQFGWEAEYSKGEIYAVHFKTGVSIQFKTYAQKIKDLQTSSVYHLTCDEEMPIEFLPELKARLNATDGYFLTVFTATLGQQYWKEAMEPTTPDEEKFKEALKIQVSLFDSQTYEDGTPSPWTTAKINRAIANCPTDAEIQRRVYGRFVKSEGLMIDAFDVTKNISESHPLPKDWQVFSGVDPGSGGTTGHPAAMVLLGVNSNYQEARVFRAWRGDGIPTTSSDILFKYKELKGNLLPVAQKYDWAAKDFFMVASQSGEAFSPAEKGRDRGISLLNTLFKTNMLKVQSGDPELQKLVSELMSVSITGDKSRAKDDLLDALRYAVMSVPWDFSKNDFNNSEKTSKEKNEAPRLLSQKELRKEWFLNSKKANTETLIEDELDYWSDLLGSSIDET